MHIAAGTTILRAYTLRKTPMRIKLVVKWATTLLAAFIAVGAAQAADKKPNIVYFLVDNLGMGELSCYSGRPLRGTMTPRIDAFAKEGMRLLNFAPETQCTPSRSALMTGRYSIRSGIKHSRWRVRMVDW